MVENVSCLHEFYAQEKRERERDGERDLIRIDRRSVNISVEFSGMNGRSPGSRSAKSQAPVCRWPRKRERERERKNRSRDGRHAPMRSLLRQRARISSPLFSSPLLFSSGNHESAERVAKKLHSGESRTVLPFHISDRHHPVTEEAQRDRRRLAREAGEAARGGGGDFDRCNFLELNLSPMFIRRRNVEEA